MRNIDFIREVTHTAAGQWQSVLSASVSQFLIHRSGIRLPRVRRNRSLPVRRQRARGHICNQCGAGDGLDLIKKVNGCDTTEAAQLVAEVLGIDYRTTQTDPSAVIERRALLEAERLQREQTRQERPHRTQSTVA
jgi:putative DNA primase/helicase